MSIISNGPASQPSSDLPCAARVMQTLWKLLWPSQTGILIAWGCSSERSNTVVSYIFISLQLRIDRELEMESVSDEATAGMHSDLLVAC